MEKEHREALLKLNNESKQQYIVKLTEIKKEFDNQQTLEEQVKIYMLHL